MNDHAWEQFRTDNKAIVDGQLVRRQLLFPVRARPVGLRGQRERGLIAKGPALVPDSSGSSFAAPRLSAREALYLLRTGLTRCGKDEPPLGYVGAAVSAQTPEWQNLGASDWPPHCPGI